MREIVAAFCGKIDFDNISKILNDFSNDLLIYFKKFFGVDVKVEKINSKNSVNRTLKTENEDANKTLWLDAGYENIPTIEENIKELSESSLTKGILNTI